MNNPNGLAQNVNFGGIGLGLLRFCLEHSDGNVTESDLSTYCRPQADYEWLKQALGNLESDADKLKKLLAKLDEKDATADTLSCVLEAIQYYIEDLDLAEGLLKQDGLARVLKFVHHEAPHVRKWAFWILASISQNHSKVQLVLHRDHQILDVLVSSLLKETDETVKEKQLYALSSVVSGKAIVDKFVKQMNALPVLSKQLECSLLSVRFKALWLLYKTVFSPSDYPAALEKGFLEKLIGFLDVGGALEGETEKDVNVRRDMATKSAEILKKYVMRNKKHAHECKELGLDAGLQRILKELMVKDKETHSEHSEEESHRDLHHQLDALKELYKVLLANL